MRNALLRLYLVGIFEAISSSVFPFDWVRGVTVYARLTDTQGVYNMRIELVRLEDEQAVGREDFQETFDRYLGGAVLHVTHLDTQEGRGGPEWET